MTFTVHVPIQMKNLLTAKKSELEQLLVDAESRLDEEEEKAKKIAQEKSKLQSQIASLEELSVFIIMFV